MMDNQADDTSFIKKMDRLVCVGGMMALWAMAVAHCHPENFTAPEDRPAQRPTAFSKTGRTAIPRPPAPLDQR